MEEFKSADDVLDFAIEREQEAHDFYMELAGKMDQPGLKKVFEGFALEEKGHKQKLIKVKEGKITPKPGKQIQDLKIGDYLVDVEPTPDMDYQQALIVAMKKEKAAYRLYTNLADTVDDAAMSDLFTSLANEEAKHKLRFEIIYDEQILTEN